MTQQEAMHETIRPLRQWNDAKARETADKILEALAAAGYAVVLVKQLESLCRLIGNGTWRDKTGCPLETTPQFENLQAMLAAAKGEA